MKKQDDYLDDKIEWLSAAPSASPQHQPQPKKYKALIAALVVLLAAVAGIVCWRLLPSPTSEEDTDATFFETDSLEATVVTSDALVALLSSFDSVSGKGCAIFEYEQNDIPLRIFYPRGATAHLCVGSQPLEDETAILVLQAADIRADNQKIVGAFVQDGKPIAWGLSKRGYCAIINGDMQVGVADNSPLFEEATDKGGCFFRQYPLVENGQPSPTELKNKSIRRGLCDVDGRIIVVESLSRESFHDFGEALADMGVSNAIYLIGSTALGSAVDLEGNREEWGLKLDKMPKNINFIYWK